MYENRLETEQPGAVHLCVCLCVPMFTQRVPHVSPVDLRHSQTLYSSLAIFHFFLPLTLVCMSLAPS